MIEVEGSKEHAYWHVVPQSRDGRASAGAGLLGHIADGWGHVHLAERRGRRVLEPASAGRDDAVRGLRRAGRLPDRRLATAGRDLGAVDLIVETFDRPPISAPQAAWHGMPVTPALVRWRLVRNARAFVPWRIASDFRRRSCRRSPASRPATSTSARSTPPGRARTSRTSRGSSGSGSRAGSTLARFPDGDYRLDVEAADIRGNASRGHLVLTLVNQERESDAAAVPLEVLVPTIPVHHDWPFSRTRAVHGSLSGLGRQDRPGGGDRPAERLGPRAPAASAPARDLAARAQQLRLGERGALLAGPAGRGPVRARLPRRAQPRARQGDQSARSAGRRPEPLHLRLPALDRRPGADAEDRGGDPAVAPDRPRADLRAGKQHGRQETLLLAARYPKSLSGRHGPAGRRGRLRLALRPRHPVRVPHEPGSRPRLRPARGRGPHDRGDQREARKRARLPAERHPSSTRSSKPAHDDRRAPERAPRNQARLERAEPAELRRPALAAPVSAQDLLVEPRHDRRQPGTEPERQAVQADEGEEPFGEGHGDQGDLGALVRVRPRRLPERRAPRVQADPLAGQGHCWRKSTGC